MSTKITDRFIKIHAVTNTPGNEVRDVYQLVDTINGFSVAPPEYAKIGAASVVDLHGDRFIYVTENIDEIYNILSTIGSLP